MSPSDSPTPYPEVNALIHELLGRVRAILGGDFVGMYLDGSLTSGDFDEDSDIDFVVVTEDEISDETFTALFNMHEALAKIDSVWAIQLEGSYVARHAMRRCDPGDPPYPNLERGLGERLKLVRHGEIWDIHRWVVQERGIIVSGPDPRTLIDPIPPDQLRASMRPMLHDWAAQILDDPAQMRQRGYQSYTVLTMCRILYTLENGTVTSKPKAMRWAQAWMDEGWVDLIERAWEGRHRSNENASAEDIQGTLDFIRYTLAQSRIT